MERSDNLPLPPYPHHSPYLPPHPLHPCRPYLPPLSPHSLSPPYLLTCPRSLILLSVCISFYFSFFFTVYRSLSIFIFLCISFHLYICLSSCLSFFPLMYLSRKKLLAFPTFQSIVFSSIANPPPVPCKLTRLGKSPVAPAGERTCTPVPSPLCYGGGERSLLFKERRIIYLSVWL